MNSRLLILLLAALVIAAGAALLLGSRLDGSPGDLAEGECFAIPEGETIEDVRRLPCDESHDGEVLFVGPYEGDAVYPSDAQLDGWVEENCAGDRFAQFVGEPFEEREDIGIGIFAPSRESWADGERRITCYLTATSGEQVSGSFRAAPGASG